MLRKWVSQYGDRVRRYGDLFRDVLVHLVSIKYIFYLSLQIFISCGYSIKGLSFISKFLFVINTQQSLQRCPFPYFLPIFAHPSLLLSQLSWSAVIVVDDLHIEDRGDIIMLVVHIEEIYYMM